MLPVLSTHSIARILCEIDHNLVVFKHSNTFGNQTKNVVDYHCFEHTDF